MRVPKFLDEGIGSVIYILIVGLIGLVILMIGGFVLGLIVFIVARILDISPLVQDRTFVAQFTEVTGVIGLVVGILFGILLKRDEIITRRRKLR